MQKYILQAESIRKSFGGVHALRGISFDLLEGEVHALVGENGAGKSTLTRIFTGDLAADAGVLQFFGKPLPEVAAAQSRPLGVASIRQQPSIFPHLTVAENIGLALEQGEPARMIDWKSRRGRARELMEQLGASIDLRRRAGSLSMAEQQIVEIAKAIGTDAKIFLMDEPTAVLTDREVRNLFSLIGRLRANGAGVVYISHRIEEVEEIADRITVLRDGESIGTRNACDVDRAELIQMMVGRPVSSVFPKRKVSIGGGVLQLRSLGNRAVGLHNISLEVCKGEIFGLAGLVGSGRSELARTIFGLTPSDSPVYVEGNACRVSSPRDAIRVGIGYLPEDRRQHGVIADLPIVKNISLADLKAVSRFGWIDRLQEERLAHRLVEQLSIKTSSIRSPAGALSGGNQQKVALARWLAARPRIMILDEPTQGVDVGSKAGIHNLIVELAEQGMAILLISSELPELLAMSDRIGVMRAGTLAGILSTENATQASIMALALGHTENIHVEKTLPC